MDDIEASYFHIKNYEIIKRLNSIQNHNILQKEKINYIFNCFKRDIDYGPYFRGTRIARPNRYRYFTKTICDSVDTGTAIRNCPVSLIRARYETKRSLIKQDLRKDCISCSDAW
jgi:hypothetical protein